MAQQQPTKVMSGAVAYAGAGPVDLSSKYSLDTYLRFGLAGALCCSVTHTAVVPIDVVKTRLQVRPPQSDRGEKKNTAAAPRGRYRRAPAAAPPAVARRCKRDSGLTASLGARPWSPPAPPRADQPGQVQGHV